MGMTPARAPSCYICGRRQLAAVRSSCAFRAALPASRTNRRCGRCVYGGECARHERRLSRVRDIKFLEGGTIRAGRRLRCHGAARAWRASEHEPGERQWAQRSDRPSMNAQGGTTSGSNDSTAEGLTPEASAPSRPSQISSLRSLIFAPLKPFTQKIFFESRREISVS